MQFAKKSPPIFLQIIFLLTPFIIFSQTKQGKTATKSISKENNDSTKTSRLYTAQVYFSGNGLQHVKMATFTNSSLNELMVNIDSASKGAFVTFEYLKSIDSEGVKNIKEIPYNFKAIKDTITTKSKAVQEVEKLKENIFSNGTIYFAGFGFPNVISVKASETKTLYYYYSRSGPGTTIAYENCIYKNANGSLSKPLNKTITLE